MDVRADIGVVELVDIVRTGLENGDYDQIGAIEFDSGVFPNAVIAARIVLAEVEELRQLTEHDDLIDPVRWDGVAGDLGRLAEALRRDRPRA